MSDTTEDQPAGNGRRLNRSRMVLLGVLALVVALVVGGFAWWHLSGRISTDDAQVEGDLNPIASRVGGTVAKVLVRENENVKAGTLLVQIDPRDYEIAVAKAQADLDEAEANGRGAHSNLPVASASSSSRLSMSASQLAGAQARLASAKARLEEATANAVRARQDLERAETLIKKDEIARRDYDAAVAASAAAKAGKDAAEAAVNEAERGIDAARAALADARTAPQQVEIANARADSSDARIAQARSALRQAELDLEYCSVKAPVDGVVTRKAIEPGQVVAEGQPLLSLVSLDDVWVVANFKESQLAKLRVGQRVKIEVDAYGGKSWPGHVESISAATGSRFSLLPPENATGNFVKVVQRIPVKIAIDKSPNGKQQDEPRLRPGMSAVPTVFVR
ncbi:MAG TPA: HlyD family secretion protein [Thermoanaerobaculia bacterium]|jgi:membrane fusion protein (multidrug efflux system)|nr:HlyD family secretion protein [Thermoanaerobaculia bacterium]